MEPFFFTADVWALAWTALATIVLLLVPGVVYAYYVLDRWIDDDASYRPVMASVDQPIRSASSTTIPVLSEGAESGGGRIRTSVG
jgi:hypothetical protein